MKFTISKASLLDGLQKVQNVVSARTTLPILSNVLLSAEKDGLYLTTTDLDVTVRCKVAAEIGKTGATTLPARRLASIIRELPDSPIDLELTDKNIVTVSCESSFFRIIGLSQDEFPPVPQADGQQSYALDQGVFREMLRKTAYAASTDETRYVLNGVLLSFKDQKLTVVATDGRRLALVEHEIEFPAEAEIEMILPSKAVNELLHTLGDDGELKILAKENQLLFEFNDVFMASKLIDGTYPNYRQVIPSHCEERVTVERECLLTAVRRAALLSAEKSSAVKVSFEKNKLVVIMSSPDIGEARETVPVKYGGKEFAIAFNPEYMMAPLKSLASDEVYLEISDELSPGVLKCDIPFLYVLMPMRIT